MKTYRPLHILSGDLWGGAEAQVHLLCKSFASSSKTFGIIPSVIVLNEGILADRLIYSEIPRHIAPESKGIISVLIDTYKYAKLQQSNLIISHGYKEGVIGFLSSKLLSLPWIHFIHGTSENYSGIRKYKMALYFCIERFLMRSSASRIVTVSKEIARDLRLDTLDKHRVIYNAAEEFQEEVKPPAERHTGRSTGESNLDKINISWLGRLSPIKRPDLAVLGFIDLLNRANTIDKKITLNIYGSGPLETELKELSKNYPQIKLHGFTELPHLAISESDLILLTSDSEGIPTVLLEAMHSKIPFITRTVGGIPEILSICPTYPAIKINNDSIQSCSVALEDAINNLEELYKRASTENTDFFKIKRLQNDHLQLYNEIL